MRDVSVPARQAGDRDTGLRRLPSTSTATSTSTSTSTSAQYAHVPRLSKSHGWLAVPVDVTVSRSYLRACRHADPDAAAA